MSKEKFTPGPWRWEVNLKHRQIKLCGGVPKYDLTVMDFVRWGMTEAQPRFLSERRPELMILEKAETFAIPVPGREHHSDWFQSLSNADAKLIALAPEMYNLLSLLLNVPPIYEDVVLKEKIESLLAKVNS